LRFRSFRTRPGALFAAATHCPCLTCVASKQGTSLAPLRCAQSARLAAARTPRPSASLRTLGHCSGCPVRLARTSVLEGEQRATRRASDTLDNRQPRECSRSKNRASRTTNKNTDVPMLSGGHMTDIVHVFVERRAKKTVAYRVIQKHGVRATRTVSVDHTLSCETIFALFHGPVSARANHVNALRALVYGDRGCCFLQQTKW